MNENTSDPQSMTDDEKRRDQMLSAPGAVESDAAPRIEVSEHDGNTRIDIAEDAAVRPGNPFETPGEDGALEGPDVEVSPSDDTPGGEADRENDDDDDEATEKPGGLGQDGTIPNSPTGIAAGHTGEQSNFNPEEDEEAPA